MSEFIGLGVSYVFILLFMGLSSLLLKLGILKGPGARKLIHIAVGHWWFIAMITIDTPWIATIGPASFIIINFLIARFHLMPAMESNGSNMGTVYYPISLLILVLFCWYWGMPKWIGASGIMVMAWGDGFAALAGQKLGKNKALFELFGSRKTLPGSLTMFFVSSMVTVVMLILFGSGPGPAALLASAIAVGLLAAVIEIFTPFGLDNISVPILSSMALWIIQS